MTVDPDVLFIDDGAVLTSAGAAAGLDLCLHVVRRDHGAAVAADTARSCVMPLERTGGQAQFIAYEPPVPAGHSLQPLLAWLTDNLHRPLTLTEIAAYAMMSPRSLSRHFREQTTPTPTLARRSCTFRPDKSREPRISATESARSARGGGGGHGVGRVARRAVRKSRSASLSTRARAARYASAASAWRSSRRSRSARIADR